MKKIVYILFVCWVLSGGAGMLFAIEHYLGVKVELGFTSGMGSNVGTFKDTMVIESSRFDGISAAPFQPHRTQTVSVDQGFQLATQLGLVYQVRFLSWLTLMTELGVGLNNGITYKGNYSQWVGSSSAAVHRIKAGEVARIDKNALEGDLRYSWTSLDFNIIGKFTVAQPSPTVSFHALAGPAMSLRISDVKESYKAVDHGITTPGNSVFDENTPRVAPSTNPFNIGVTAGVGVDFVVGNRGLISLEGRTTWMFRPQLQTYMSEGEFFGVSKPFSINIAYSYRLGK